MIVLTDYVTCVYVIYPNNQWVAASGFGLSGTNYSKTVNPPISMKKLLGVSIVDIGTPTAGKVYSIENLDVPSFNIFRSTISPSDDAINIYMICIV